jgi:uncharacterized protein YfaP (DUF2135 family)
VIDPSGNLIWFADRFKRNGSLDDDIRIGRGKESILILALRPGSYQVIITDYSNSGNPNFDLKVLVDGKTSQVYIGSLQEKRRMYILEIDTTP